MLLLHNPLPTHDAGSTIHPLLPCCAWGRLSPIFALLMPPEIASHDGTLSRAVTMGTKKLGSKEPGFLRFRVRSEWIGLDHEQDDHQGG